MSSDLLYWAYSLDHRLWLLSLSLSRDAVTCLEQQTKTFSEAVEQYAQLGLRTLCLAWRELDDDEYQEWSLMFKEANSTLVDREVLWTSEKNFRLLVDSYVSLTPFIVQFLFYACFPNEIRYRHFLLPNVVFLFFLFLTVESGWGLSKVRAWPWNPWGCCNRGSSTGY